MSEPIEPDDIRVGDVVAPVMTPFVVSRLSNDIAFAADTSGYSLVQPGVIDHWELVSRPAPKPEIGQHWLSPDGREWVVLARNGALMFYRLEALAAAVPAATAPDGWTLKP